MLCPLSFADHTADSRVRAAATEVAGEFVMRLFGRGIGILVEQRLGSDHESRRAEPTLLGVIVDECLLDGMELSAGSSDALDRLYLLVLSIDGQNRASINGMAVNEHGASATLGTIANALGSSEVERIPKGIEQSD